MRLSPLSIAIALVAVCPTGASAETVTVATYNIEHFENHFEAHRLRRAVPRATTRPSTRPATPGARPATGPRARPTAATTAAAKPWRPAEAERAARIGAGFADGPDDLNVGDLLQEERRQNDEDNWEVAEVIADERFNPDVLVIQEGCSQDNLEYFNERWLKKAYGTAVVFPTNTDRNQHLGMLLKPGFKLVEQRDEYYLEKDTIGNNRGDRLFARGPAFCLIETPNGYRFWVGVTHQKSKSGNSVDVTKWRNREAARTHEIMKELRQQGPADVVLLGDMNDDLGLGEFEAEAGGDTIANLVGPPADKFLLATQPLAEKGEISFGGYWNTRYRSFIDHVVMTPEMKDQVQSVGVFKDGLARSASDHYPVYVKIRSDAAPPQPGGNVPAAR